MKGSRMKKKNLTLFPKNFDKVNKIATDQHGQSHPIISPRVTIPQTQPRCLKGQNRTNKLSY